MCEQKGLSCTLYILGMAKEVDTNGDVFVPLLRDRIRYLFSASRFTTPSSDDGTSFNQLSYHFWDLLVSPTLQEARHMLYRIFRHSLSNKESSGIFDLVMSIEVLIVIKNY